MPRPAQVLADAVAHEPLAALKKPKRKVGIAVISDVHLGTFGCHAKELFRYLKSIKPGILVLNGDIIDIWQFSKRYWPKSHMKVVRHILELAGKGTKVYYITGNHDELLRRFSGMRMGSLRIVNKLLLELENGEKAWFFHGDVFDVTMQHSRWLAKLGAVGYDTLILINRAANFISEKVFKKGKLSLSKKIKNGVKGAVKFINSFEETAASIGISNGYHYVICGHIHQPQMRVISNSEGTITYLNSGDWIENLTSLEYTAGEWKLYRFSHEEYPAGPTSETEHEPSNTDLFDELLGEFRLMNIAG